ncbi:unnamed protein product, partial [Durusdinium trenchii]
DRERRGNDRDRRGEDRGRDGREGRGGDEDRPDRRYAAATTPTLRPRPGQEERG